MKIRKTRTLREEFIRFRVSNEELRKAMIVADHRGLSLSAYVRTLMLEDINKRAGTPDPELSKVSDDNFEPERA